MATLAFFLYGQDIFLPGNIIFSQSNTPVKMGSARRITVTQTVVFRPAAITTRAHILGNGCFACRITVLRRQQRRCLGRKPSIRKEKKAIWFSTSALGNNGVADTATVRQFSELKPLGMHRTCLHGLLSLGPRCGSFPWSGLAKYHSAST
jgi:hypothetical protein